MHSLRLIFISLIVVTFFTLVIITVFFPKANGKNVGWTLATVWGILGYIIYTL